MDGEYESKSLKIMFSLITIFLMIPLLVSNNDDKNYYRTIFIFLASKDIDLLTTSSVVNIKMFRYWDFINQFVGSILAALSCALLFDDFASIFNDKIIWCLKICLILSVLSIILKELFELLVLGIKTKLITNNINKTKNELKESKGDDKNE